MSRRAYTHSAYWYAYHYGYTHSDATTYAGQYLDMHTYIPGGKGNGVACVLQEGKCYDSTFDPVMLGVMVMLDIGVAMRETVRAVADPEERARMKAELRRDLRIVRRPFYYFRETERRRRLAAERRKIGRRRTTAPMPTPEEVRAAWEARKGSKEAMIRLGGMLHDLACYVDSALRFDEYGNVVGRNGGIRRWIQEFVPELFPKYKTLMRYKAMAMKLRQATDTKDPVPTAKLLEEPRPEVVETLLQDFRKTFSSLEEGVASLIDPEGVFTGRPDVPAGRGRPARGSSGRERSMKRSKGRGKATPRRKNPMKRSPGQGKAVKVRVRRGRGRRDE